jgi:AhpD family alkylhydroperoxidase
MDYRPGVAYMSEESSSKPSRQELITKRNALAPEPLQAWRAFSSAVFAPGALDAVTKQLIAVAVAHVTQCPDCIRGHTRGAVRAGATEQQIVEAIWVAAEMRAGASTSHSVIAMEELERIRASHEHGG